MSSHRAEALKAVDEAFADGVKHLYVIFELGLLTGKPPLEELTEHFMGGLARHCDAHNKTIAAVIKYFQEIKP